MIIALTDGELQEHQLTSAQQEVLIFFLPFYNSFSPKAGKV